MLNFTTSLVNALSKTATRSYWLLRLYYNDESNFTGISDLTRTIGGVIYYGLADWGSHNQTLNIDQFTTSNGTMEVGLSNAPNKLHGGRFSDFIDEDGNPINYSNRKWELFQCDENAAFSEDNLIAGGIISSDIKPTPTQITMYLNDYWEKYNIEIPLDRVLKSDYPDAPEKNLDAPIPMWYGDFDTLPNVPAGDFERHFVKGRVPAIVTGQAGTSAFIEAFPDSEQARVTLNQLNPKNIFMYTKSKYIACDSANVIANVAVNNSVFFKGVAWFGLYDFARVDDVDNTITGDETNIIDDSFISYATWSLGGNVGNKEIDLYLSSSIEQYGLNTVSGQIIDVLLFFGTFGGTAANLFEIDSLMGVQIDDDLIWNTAYQLENDAGTGDLVGEGVCKLQMNTLGDSATSVQIIKINLQVEVEPADTYTVKVLTGSYRTGNLSGGRGAVNVYRDEAATELDMVFVSGIGREYDTWIANGESLGRTNGFSATNPIKNPVYIIEDILRTELGLTKTKINTISFDAAGNTTDGDIEDGFNSDAASILFAFSQPKLIRIKSLIGRICEQSGSYVWWGGDEMKIKARRRTYTSAVQTIDFKDVKIIDFDLTPMNDIRNYITVNYNFDYAISKTVKSRTPDDNASLKDATSYGNGVNGYNQTLSISGTDYFKEGELNFDMPFTLDQTTADNYGEALLAWFKDRKQIITIQGKKDTARYNSLEIGDIINFSNWDANLKVLGDTITTADGFMITQITKSPDGPRIQVTEVAGTIS